MLTSSHSIWSGHTGRYLKDADQYTLPQNVLYFSVCMIGSGLVVLPYITSLLSFPVVIVSLAVIASSSRYTHSILIEMADDYDLSTFEDVAEASFGQIGYYFTWLLQLSFTLFSSVMNLSAATQLFGFYLGRDVDFTYPNQSVGRLLIVVMLAAPSLLITLVRMPRKMVVFHFLALCAVIGAGCLLLAMIVSELREKTVATHAHCWLPSKSIDVSFFEGFMLLMFCFVGHHKALDAFNQLRLREESGRWKRVVSRSVAVVFVVYFIGVVASLVCSNTPNNSCSTVSNHRLFELFFAIALSLIVPSDMRSSRRLMARLIGRCQSASFVGRMTEQGNLVVFSQDGNPTMQGMSLGTDHFANDSRSDSASSSESKSLENSTPSFSRIVDVENCINNQQDLQSTLLNNDIEESADNVTPFLLYQPPFLDSLVLEGNEALDNQRQYNENGHMAEEDTITKLIEEQKHVVEVRGSECSRDSESVLASSTDSSRSSLDVPNKRNIVSKFRKGVARTTGAHGFFSRSTSKISPSGTLAYDEIPNIESVGATNREGRTTQNMEYDDEAAEKEVDHTLVTPIDEEPQSSLLPPQRVDVLRDPPSKRHIEPFRNSAWNKSWPNPYRGQSESAVCGLGDNRIGTRDVGAWAFSPRPSFKPSEGDKSLVGERGKDELQQSYHPDRDTDIISNISDGDDIAEKEPFGCGAFQQFPATLTLWLLIVACAWVTNFAPAIILMTYMGGFGAAVLGLVLPAACYFKLAPLSSDFSAVVKFGTVRNEHLMPLVLILGLLFVCTKVGLVMACSLLDSDWCLGAGDVTFFNQGSEDCF